MTKNRTLSERLLAAVLCLVLLAGMVPVNILRASAAENDPTVITNLVGTETTDDDGNITIDVSGANVVYDAAANGWQVSVSVTAPVGTDLSKAKFGDELFSQGGSDTRTYTQTLTPGDEGTAVVNLSGEFDWDGDSETPNQTITMSGTVNLVKAEQTIAISGESTLTFGAEAVYNVDDIQSGAVASYKVVQEEEVVELAENENGTATLKTLKPGTAKLTVSVAGNEHYKEANAELEITVQKADQIVSIVGSETIAYDAEAVYSVEGIQSNENAKFTVENVTGAAELTGNENGKVTLKATKPGTVKLVANVKGNEYYNAASDEMDITVSLVPQDQFGFLVESDSYPYGETKVYALTGVESSNVPVVSVSDESLAKVTLLSEVNAESDETTYSVQVEALKVGFFTVSVSVESDGWYDEGNDSLDITVSKADQAALTFATSYPANVAYNAYPNNQMNFSVTGGSGSGDVVYETSDKNIAEISDKGIVTIKQAGKVTINVTKKGDDYYNEAKISFTMTIAKADQKINLTKMSDSVSNKDETYSIGMTTEAGWVSGGEYEFVITSADESMSGTSVDKKTGVISIGEGDYGNVTVKVTRSGDDCFNAWPAAEQEVLFTLTVTQMVIANKNFSLEGTKTANTNEWYTSDVTVRYTSGDNAYLLAAPQDDGKKHDHGNFQNAFMITEDGIYAADDNSVILCVKENVQNHPAMAHGVNLNEQVGSIKIDSVKPDGNIKYTKSLVDVLLEGLTFGYYQADVSVTVTAEDATSGVASIWYNYNGKWIEYQVDNGAKKAETSFKISGTYNGTVQYYVVDVAGNSSEEKETDTIIIDKTKPEIEVTWSAPEQDCYYAEEAVATIRITEENFFAEDVVIKDNDKTVAVEKKNWKQTDEGPWTLDVTLSEEGDHVLTVEYTDRSNNTMDPYTSELVVIDHTDPVVSVSPVNEGTRAYYGAEQTIVVTVNEHNFDAEDVEFIITAQDVTGTNVEATVTYGEWTNDGDIHTIELIFADDANYDLDVTCTDLALRQSNDLPNQLFTVDKTAPQNLAISYSTSLLDKIIDAVTFGYYKEPMTVTLTAVDDTASIDSFSYEYILNEDVSSVNKGGSGTVETTRDGNVFTANFQIPVEKLTNDNQFNGYITFIATDRSGNFTKETDQGEKAIVVDDINPTSTVTFNKPANSENGVDYYSGNVDVTININEANFFAEDVKVIVTRDQVAYPVNVAWADNSADEHVGTFTLTEAGDYIVSVNYTDRSTNEMVPYTSGKKVIDLTDPVVSVSPVYEGTRTYCNGSQTVTVTVNEHNFCASAVIVDVAALDSANKDVAVANYAVLAADEANWKHNGDVHTLELVFDTDANYTLDVACTDLALRQSNDLAEQLFTVDKTAPESMKISYETSVTNSILNGITFGYYEAQTTVTITVVDYTSGIDYLDYEYTLNPGVSSVNRGGSGTVETKHDGNTYTASFKIPESALTASNQFNGYISFTATDRSSNTSFETDQNEQAVVVDNIRPTATVTYNAPVQQAGGVSYYDGNINATITINEANFFSEDVAVTVTRNGANYPVNVRWTDNTVDKHTGTFTLTEDGDYVVSINYTDRSTNQMVPYTSGQMTLDTEIPTISVSGIENNSANTDEVYSFTITASDTNFDVDGFTPKLTALVRGENGSYVTKTIDLGSRITVEEGKTYTYQVANLEEDAIYTLTCYVEDLADNSSSMMVLDDGSQYQTVQFSINRDGSTFALGENTANLVNSYYTQYVTADLTIVEVNPDVLEKHTVTLNGKTLTEGTDYTVTTEGGNGSWMMYTYTISKNLLEGEGEYMLVVSSTDKAGNNAFSDVKDATVSFVVDRTAPVVTVTGMADNGRYQTESQTVTLIPTDDGGALSSIVVTLVDNNGNVVKELLNLSGDALMEALKNGDGMLTFEIGEGLYQNVRIVCEDCAQSADGANVYDVTFQNLSVSASGFMIFWANRALRNGVIILLLLLLLVVIYLLTRKKKKK